MDIKKLEELREKYKNVIAQLQRLEGEENQLIQEKNQIIKKLESYGFANKEELDSKIKDLEEKITLLVNEIGENCYD